MPALAERAGLKITQGVWLGDNRNANSQEIAAGIAIARQHPNVERLIVGNEVVLQSRLPLQELIADLERVRAAVSVPVSTAEPWHVWLEHPELAEHVDFITVHLLPYWEQVLLDDAVDSLFERLQQVQARFPGKPVVIGEVGWPSGGETRGGAVATPAAQAQFVRSFLASAQPLGLDFYLMEAFDQPWKTSIEGRAGPHWGWFDAYRQPKFALSGPVLSDAYWPGRALVSCLLGIAFTLPILLRFSHLSVRAQLVFGAVVHVVAGGLVMLMALPMVNYLRPIDIAVWLGLLPAVLLMGAMLIAQTFEFVELYWPGGLRNIAPLRPAREGLALPLVSVHLACSNEPPAMVLESLRRLFALDWPQLEICIVDNNTRDPALWQPLAAWVGSLAETHPEAQLVRDEQHDRWSLTVTMPGRRVVLLHLPVLPGFKAGALNEAMALTSPQAAWIGVIDADYQVAPDWLRSLAGYLEDPAISLVQCPQAHRQVRERPLSRMMDSEYSGFFRCGMHHRHQRNAIIQHGTMTLVRAGTLRALGGWDAQTICEDTELGLRILAAGGQAVYVDQVFGTGLVPADSPSYLKQRFRWACGAMQILRLHRHKFGWRSALSVGQRYHFIAGWLPWWGDTLHLLFSVACVGWSLGMLVAPTLFGLPDWHLMVPLAGLLLCRLLTGPLLHARRVTGSLPEIIGAALAGMALSHRIALGVLRGLFGPPATFVITRRQATTQKESDQSDPDPRAGSALRQHLISVWQESALLVLLATCLSALAWSWGHQDIDRFQRLAWLMMLAMQAVPYMATLLLSAVSWVGVRSASTSSRA